LGIWGLERYRGKRVEENEQEKVKKKALTVAAPPPTTAGRCAATTGHRTISPSEKTEQKEREESKK